MTVWHWVRHGPTHERAFVGWRDVPADLSDTAALGRLRDHLPERALLVSSDLLRASATADAIAGDGHDRLPHEADLREFDFGDWDGLHFTEVAERDPDLSRTYWEAPGDVAPPAGESWNAAARRIDAAVARLNRRYPASHIIAVAHIGTILTQVRRALGETHVETIARKIDNLSVTEIRWQGATGQVTRINHCP
ncbi:histidine phosphatase family protein [Sulfitobacter sp. D35]|uniref:histidine phosphatase family protein n=1 Tax=Sulfitobacter sp. D35 TaxID=3083252 RepID=UPI00296EA33C|nr:histidine phosphatase family protein [Sulfitobacter sp. D35]MDW4499013.1 histidine phosphatase family protein [Sulfitobacter sp. D35]